MVQAGATACYDASMDERPDPSRALAIRTAVGAFVEAVNQSSRELARATERFAIESSQIVDSAVTRSEHAAATSAEQARAAQHAAEEARNATSSIQAAVEAGRESVREQARSSSEQSADQAAQINELTTQAKHDLQERIEELAHRLETGEAAQAQALDEAQTAISAAQAAAERIQSSVSAVEAAVAVAQQAAREARSAATETERNAGSTSLAVANAKEAAEASRQSASLAEEAGKRSDFAAEASMLLERLEADYSLLTRLVQELHSRISSLSSVSVAPSQPVHQTAIEPVAYEAQEDTADPDAAALDAARDNAGPAAGSPTLQNSQEPSETASEQAPHVSGEESLAETPPVVPSIKIHGRVQMTLSPVPDFDRLLSLDSALACIEGVKGVTLADYAREEVFFRVELEHPVTAAEFAQALSETAGVPTTVTGASESTLSVRIS